MPFFERLLINRFFYQSKRPFSTLIIAIAIIGIALGLSVMISSVAIMTGFQSTIEDKVRGFSGDLQLSLFSLNESPENEPFRLDHHDLDKIRRVAGVRSVSGFATKPGILNHQGSIEGIVLKGISTQTQTEFFFSHLVQGSPLRLTPDKISNEVLISKAIASKLNIHIGDPVLLYFIQEPVRKRKLTVTGIYDLGMDELDKLYVIGDLRLIQRLNDWLPTQVGGIQIDFTDARLAKNARAELSAFLPLKLKIFTTQQLYPQLFDWLSLTRVNVRVILILMFLVGGINMISALLIMILERTSTIGILKALGARNGQLSSIFLSIAAYLIVIGLGIGDVIGIGFCWYQQTTHSIKLNQDIYYMSYVPVQLSWWTVLALNAGTLVVCFVMVLGPSLLVSRIQPVRAIRFR